MFELYNGHPQVFNFGNELHISAEKKWDQLLSAGHAVYAVASDDAHHFQEYEPKRSNPGRGWVMVRAEALTPDAIAVALQAGEFYATSGVILKTLTTGNGVYRVAVDEVATSDELSSPFLTGRHREFGSAGYRIDFIGQDGYVLESMDGPAAAFTLKPGLPWVRCRITFGLQVSAGVEEFYAWTQPFFADNREIFP